MFHSFSDFLSLINSKIIFDLVFFIGFLVLEMPKTFFSFVQNNPIIWVFRHLKGAVSIILANILKVSGGNGQYT